jgi:hypothetical protein
VGVTGTGIGGWIGQNYNELASAAGLATGVDFDTTPWGRSYDTMLEHLLDDDICGGDWLYADNWPADANPQVKQTIKNRLKKLMLSEDGFGGDPEGAFQTVMAGAQGVDDKMCAYFNNEESYGQIFDAIWAQRRLEEAAKAVGVDISDPQWMCNLGDEIGFGQDTGECPNLANMDDWQDDWLTRAEELNQGDLLLEEYGLGELEDLKEQIAGLDAELGTSTNTDGLSIAQLEGHLRRLEREQSRMATEGGAPSEPTTRDPFEPLEEELELELQVEPQPQGSGDFWD